MENIDGVMQIYLNDIQEYSLIDKNKEKELARKARNGDKEAIKRHENILIGKADYTEVARGDAMLEKGNFAKMIVNRDNFKVLGFHIIGPQASILIQEIINLMALDLSLDNLWGMHIHPALSELVMTTLNNLEER
jgi:dihydrolipoamide dehydrogenase